MARRTTDPIYKARKTAEAESAFVAAAVRELPPQALRELFSMSPSEVPAWADRWRLNAPCMVRYATGLQEWVQADPEPGLANELAEDIVRLDVASHPDDTESRRWVQELRRVDSLAPSPFRRDPVGEVMSDEEFDKKVAGKGLDAEAWRRRREETRELRRKAAATDDALRHIAADPVPESREQFLKRAEHHYDARASRAQLLGAALWFHRSSPKLHRDVRWLLRKHLRRESYAHIAKAEQVPGLEPDKVVQFAVSAVAKLVQLRLDQPRGRPRRLTSQKGRSR